MSRKTSYLGHLIVSAVKSDEVYFCGYVKLVPFVHGNYKKGKELDLGAEPTRITLNVRYRLGEMLQNESDWIQQQKDSSLAESTVFFQLTALDAYYIFTIFSKCGMFILQQNSKW